MQACAPANPLEQNWFLVYLCSAAVMLLTPLLGVSSLDSGRLSRRSFLDRPSGRRLFAHFLENHIISKRVDGSV